MNRLVVVLLYNCLLPVVFLLALPGWLIKMYRRGGFGSGMLQRLAIFNRPAEKEKQGGIYATGQSLKQGELTVTSFKTLDTATVNRCFVMYEHDVILSLSDMGSATVWD